MIPRSREFGQASVVILVVVFVGLLVGGVRYFRLGDLSMGSKLVESLLWGLGTVVGGLLLSGLASATLKMSGEPTPRRREGASRGVSPEELSAFESELPEKERPEFGGVHGRPPEEMAEMIRKMAGGDGV